MPKRKSSANFTCPDCQPEIESMVSSTTADDTPVILKPEFLPFLYQVINQLKPEDFVEFARTSRTIHRICFNNKRIKIPLNIPFIAIETGRPLSFSLANYIVDVNFILHEIVSDEFVSCDYTGDENSFLCSKKNREKLKKYPFVFKLDELNLSYSQVTEDSIAKIRSFLAEFPIQSIRKIRSLPLRRRRHSRFDVDIEDWKGFTQFVEDFGVEDVEIHSGIPDDDDDEKLLRIPDDAADYLVNNHARFRTDRFVSDSVILNASVRCLDLRNASISQETFLRLLKKIATSTADFVWKIGREPFEFGHYDMFEAVDVFHDEDFDGPLPQKRPLVFYDKQEERCLQFCILREDGKRIMCEDHGGCVVFCSSEEKDGLEDKYEEDLLIFL